MRKKTNKNKREKNKKDSKQPIAYISTSTTSRLLCTKANREDPIFADNYYDDGKIIKYQKNCFFDIFLLAKAATARGIH